jgi:hypothetical protein
MGSTQHPMLDTLLKNLIAFNRNLEKMTGPSEEPQKSPPSPREKKVRFTDWVLELTASEMGKRYLKKLRKLVLRLINKEKKKMKQKYRSRYRNKKPSSPPVHQQPPPIPMRTQSTETDPDITSVLPEQTKTLNTLVANKLSSLEIEEAELKLKLQNLEEKLQHCEAQTKDFKNAVQQKKAKRKSILVKSHSVDIPTISDSETVIKNIRNRIESLEAESEQLFSSFKAYLEKKNHQHTVDELTKEKVLAWQLLQKSQANLEKYAKPAQGPMITVASPPLSEQTPAINLSTSTESKKSSPKAYRNPFHEIKLDEVLRQRGSYGRNVKVGQQASDALRRHFDEVWKPAAKVEDKENNPEMPKLTKTTLKERYKEKSPEIREIQLNETFLKEPTVENVAESSSTSRRSSNKSISKKEEMIEPAPPLHTEPEVTVINRQQHSKESSLSLSSDKVVISTGNVMSSADVSEDFWD